ncbi:MAG: capsular polysaccharide biosynthesis protein [Cyanobacteriota bacterium]|nr:capsular polysaccharide biosynthesis protein [Cyanobacteriota bacterium]
MSLPLPHADSLGIPHRGLLRHSTVPSLLAPANLVKGRRRCRRSELDALLAWGRKPSGAAAAAIARQRGLPLWRLEDGFLRSMGLGGQAPPLSLLVDDLGVHYDATGPSRLETLIAAPLNEAQRQRARHLRELWCREGVSKYNPDRDSPRPDGPYVLVVDQTAGDLSIGLGLASPAVFRTMLASALADYPDHTVVLRVHPGVVGGRRRGHFTPLDWGQPRVWLSADGGHPAALLDGAAAVYAVSSQLGFEALLRRKPVHCFGMPFYAGWGLTHDRLVAPDRRRDAGVQSLDSLVYGALIAYPRCIDPHTWRPCPPEQLIEAIGLQRRQRRRWPPSIEALGFAPWKRPVLRRYLAGSRLHFRRQGARPSPAAAAVAIWGRREGAAVQRWRERWPERPLLRVEDGFLRSVGLGADLITPLSWVIDRTGMYYDATAPSDLETLLATAEIDLQERRRASRLRQRLVEQAITKYNLSAPPWQRPAAARRVVLVPGQVERDASIRHGAPGIRSNLELLRAVRAAEPDAYLVYKPHPDVVAGLCSRGNGEEQAADWCDEVLVSASIQQLFTQVDALHVLTSIAGFEALLRGLPVHTWGLPFYAGWGLTHDRVVCRRRGRPRDLDELVHAVLIAYPTYVSRRSGWMISPEQALQELIAWREGPPEPLTLVQRIFRHWGRLGQR